MDAVNKWQQWHGFAGNEQWEVPKLVTKSDQSARPDQGNHIKANEYLDSDQVLDAKMQLVAQLVLASQFCCAYTGAGLSKASGIPDYATKESVVKAPTLKSNLDAEPTYAHCTLTAMERAGLLHHYVQQNHDGLPQKSGFPQHKINEIHGAWYDPSNPVVQFSGSLRTDLFDWLLEAEQRTDLCLCLGTSLSGMNADRIAKTAANKSRKNKALGTVVINLQQTPLDQDAVVRVWAKLDDAFKLLVKYLDLKAEIKKIDIPIPSGDVYEVPYNAEGYLDESVTMTWDLRPGTKVVIPLPEAMNAASVGVIEDRKRNGHYCVALEEDKSTVHRLFGSWWVDEALNGRMLRLPIVNLDPVIKPRNKVQSEKN